MSCRRRGAPPQTYATIALLVALGAAGCSPQSVETFATGLACTDLNDVGVGQPREIRLVALYTQGAAAAAGSAANIENEIQLAFAEMNDVFERSEVPVHAVLAHMEQVTLTEPQPDSDILTQLINGTGTLAVAHTLRVAHFADIVALITTSSGGITRRMLAPSMAARDQAYLVAGRWPMGQQFTLTHEVGHVLGGVDGRPTNPLSQPRYRYAYAQVCTTCLVNGLTGWHTMMGTPTFLADGVHTTTRIEHFANPDILYFGTPTGSVTDPYGDNRLTLYHTATLVAAFQYTPTWFVTLGAEGPWYERRVDASLMPEIRIGDFNNDRRADALRVDATTNTWYVSDAAAEPWKVVFVDPRKAPMSDLRIGDFDGDGAAEVFYADLVDKKWVVWRGGTDWVPLNVTAAAAANIPVTQLAFANFTGDRKTDVFWSDVANDSWKISDGGTLDWSQIQAHPSLKVNTEQLRAADFNNDGVADIFRSDVASKEWRWSKNGTAPWATLNGPDPELAVDVTDLAIGDFDGDGAADVLKPTGVSWMVARSGQGSLQLLKLSCARVANMALGDFDGDGSTDVMRAGIRP
ncbi:MAG TPA: M12 family metallo-peptidase [Gemmatimonadaceae bacterium]|nr:M12 family metallo-peptidase [Gemmatimonadaceae bacterium]